MALVLRDIALLEHGATINGSVEAGQTVCVVGPAGAGKTRLLRVLGGQEPPDRGEISLPGVISIPEPCNRKMRPQDLSHKRGANQAAAATEVLSQLGLWDVRQRPISDLGPAHVAACDLLDTFISTPDLIILDGCLDTLDPWARTGVLRLIRSQGSRGAITVVATNHLELATNFDWLVVMREHQAIFVGMAADLIRSQGQRKLTIESERNQGVRALVDSLQVSVTRTDLGYRLEPGPGQESTARLLREGYGDVKYVVSDEKSLPEIILGLIS